MRIFGRFAGLLALAASAAVAGLCATPALADTTVPGSEYAVSFLGQGSANWTDDASPDDNFVNKGTFTIQDNPANLWLPAVADPAEEGTDPGVDGSTTDSPYDAQIATNTADPATLSDTGVSNDVAYSCSSSAIYDDGTSFISAAVMLGALQVSTTSESFPPRSFDVAFNGNNYSSCTSGDGMSFAYPPEGPDGDGGTIAYAATVPFSDVGQASFSLPVTDQSTVNTAPYWTGVEGTHTFSVSGSYTFTKLCDGTIDYTADGQVIPACAGGGGTPGGSGSGGNGGNNPPPPPPPVIEPPQPAGGASGGGSATVGKHGTVAVGHSQCKAKAPCKDATTLTSSGAHGAAVAAKHKKRPKAITYARSTTTVPAGKTVVLKVKLSRKALALLKRHGKLKTIVKIVITSPGSKTVTRHFKLTIRPAKTRRR